MKKFIIVLALALPMIGRSQDQAWDPGKAFFYGVHGLISAKDSLAILENIKWLRDWVDSTDRVLSIPVDGYAILAPCDQCTLIFWPCKRVPLTGKFLDMKGRDLFRKRFKHGRVIIWDTKEAFDNLEIDRFSKDLLH